jgi:hypothetical protein
LPFIIRYLKRKMSDELLITGHASFLGEVGDPQKNFFGDFGELAREGAKLSRKLRVLQKSSFGGAPLVSTKSENKLPS